MIIVGNIYAGLNTSGTSTVNTANGISGDGSVGTPIVLGGNPLINNTVIDLDGFEFDFTDLNVNIQINNSQLSISYDNPGNSQTVYIQDPTRITQTVINEANNDTCFVGLIDSNNFLLQVFEGATGDTKEIQGDLNSGEGIVIADGKDNVGFSGNVLFPKNGSPKQYAQYGNVSSIDAFQDVPGLSTTQIVATVVVPSGDGVYRVSVQGFYRTGLGSVAMTVDYTDIISASRSASFGAALDSTNVITAYPPLIIKAKAGTNVNLTFTLTGAMIYDAVGIIEFLGS